jgi:hypothetical protein
MRRLTGRKRETRRSKSAAAKDRDPGAGQKKKYLKEQEKKKLYKKLLPFSEQVNFFFKKKAGCM